MKCPKCGYHSFDYLESCKKCGGDLKEHKRRYGLRDFLFAGRGRPAVGGGSPALRLPAADAGAAISSAPTAAETAQPSLAGDDNRSFGFDPLSAEEPAAEELSALDLSWELEPSSAAGQRGEPSAPAAEGAPADFAFADPLPAPEAANAFSPEAAAEPLAADDFGITADLERSELDAGAAGLEDPGWSVAFFADPSAGGEPASAEPAPGAGRSVLEPLPELEPELDLAGRFFDSLPRGEEGPEAAFDSFPEPPEGLFTAADLQDAGTAGLDPLAEQAEAPTVEPLPTASVGRRFAAGVVDLLILGLVCVSFVAAGELLFIPAAGDGGLLNLAALLDLSIPYFLLFFAVTFGYFTLFHFLTGQTPGKMFLRLRVEAADGASLLFSQAFLRSVGGLLSLLAAGAGFLRIFFDPERRGWNDRLAGSRVVPVGCPGEAEEASLPEPDAGDDAASA